MTSTPSNPSRRPPAYPPFRRFARLVPFAAVLATVSACDRGEGQPETVTPDDELLDEELPEQDAVEKAGGLVMSGRPAAGLEEADAALESDPDNAELHFVRGMALQALGKGEAAIDAWETALSHDPRLFAALDGIGTVHLDAGRLDEAKGYFERALEVDPKFAGSHYNLGIIAVQQGDLAAAKASFLRASELNPEDADALLELAAVYEKQGKRDEATAMVMKAVEVDPANGYAQMVKGDVLAVRGAPVDEVVAAYEKAVAADAGLMNARLKLVRALRKADNAEAALEHSALLVEQVPDQPIPWSDHAGVLTDLGRYDEAVIAAERALALDTTLVSGHRRKILALAGAGKCKEASAAVGAFRDAAKLEKKQLAEAKADAETCKK